VTSLILPHATGGRTLVVEAIELGRRVRPCVRSHGHMNSTPSTAIYRTQLEKRTVRNIEHGINVTKRGARPKAASMIKHQNTTRTLDSEKRKIARSTTPPSTCHAGARSDKRLLQASRIITYRRPQPACDK